MDMSLLQPSNIRPWSIMQDLGERNSVAGPVLGDNILLHALNIHNSRSSHMIFRSDYITTPGYPNQPSPTLNLLPFPPSPRTPTSLDAMPQDLPPSGGYEPIQYKVSFPTHHFHRQSTATSNKLTAVFPIPSATCPRAGSALPTTSSPWVSSAPTDSTRRARGSESKSMSPSPSFDPLHPVSAARDSVSLPCGNSRIGSNERIGFEGVTAG